MNPNKTERFARITHLFSVLTSLSAQLQQEMASLRCDMEEAFGKDAIEKPMQVVSIVETVSGVMGATSLEIFGRGRTRRESDARHTAMWCVSKKLRMTVSAIGSYFDVDHSAVVHACRKVEVLAATDERFRTMLTKVCNSIGLPVPGPESTPRQEGLTLVEVFAQEANR